MLTRIRNAQKSRKETTEIPYSGVKFSIAEILKQEGYVSSVEKTEDFPRVIRVTLKYDRNQGAISSITRESTPGHRKYCKASDMPKVLNGYGIAVVSTPQGIMTAGEAKKRGVGGELLCSIY
jgi:small subunit ribosomal protein S8